MLDGKGGGVYEYDNGQGKARQGMPQGEKEGWWWLIFFFSLLFFLPVLAHSLQ